MNDYLPAVNSPKESVHITDTVYMPYTLDHANHATETENGGKCNKKKINNSGMSYLIVCISLVYYACQCRELCNTSSCVNVS